MPHELEQRTTAPFITGTRTQETFLPPEKTTAFEDLRSTLDDPQAAAGPLIQTLLAALAPSEDRARLKQADEFRSAGAISDASRAVASSRLEGDIVRNRQTTGVQALLQFLVPLISGRVGALQGIPALSRSESANFGFAPVQRRQDIRSAPRPTAARANASGQQDFQTLLDLVQGTNQSPPLGQQQQQPAPSAPSRSAGTPSFGATSFAPGTDFAPAPGQTSFTNQDLTAFQDFSQEDQDFFFGRG